MQPKVFLKAAKRMERLPKGMPLNLYGMCFSVWKIIKPRDNSYIKFLEKYFTPVTGTAHVYWFRDHNLSDVENQQRRVLALLFAYEMSKGGLE